jgi:hypothetical protein
MLSALLVSILRRSALLRENEARHGGKSKDRNVRQAAYKYLAIKTSKSLLLYAHSRKGAPMNLRVTAQNEFRDAKHKVTEPKLFSPLGGRSWPPGCRHVNQQHRPLMPISYDLGNIRRTFNARYYCTL